MCIHHLLSKKQLSATATPFQPGETMYQDTLQSWQSECSITNTKTNIETTLKNTMRQHQQYTTGPTTPTTNSIMNNGQSLTSNFFKTQTSEKSGNLQPLPHGISKIYATAAYPSAELCPKKTTTLEANQDVECPLKILWLSPLTNGNKTPTNIKVSTSLSQNAHGSMNLEMDTTTSSLMMTKATSKPKPKSSSIISTTLNTVRNPTQATNPLHPKDDTS